MNALDPAGESPPQNDPATLGESKEQLGDPEISAVAHPTDAGSHLLSPAGFWVRVVAAITDGLLVVLVQGLFGLLLGGAIYLLTGSVDAHDSALLAGVVTLSSMLVGAAYYVFFTGYCGQTPGKMAIRVKVVRTDGGDIGYGRAFVREIPGKFLSGILLGIGYLIVAFDARKQGLHDKIAETLVVKI
jgi:uncharacterized RDD family membrane protein YckC